MRNSVVGVGLVLVLVLVLGAACTARALDGDDGSGGRGAETGLVGPSSGTGRGDSGPGSSEASTSDNSADSSGATTEAMVRSCWTVSPAFDFDEHSWLFVDSQDGDPIEELWLVRSVNTRPELFQVQDGLPEALPRGELDGPFLALADLGGDGPKEALHLNANGRTAYAPGFVGGFGDTSIETNVEVFDLGAFVDVSGDGRADFIRFGFDVLPGQGDGTFIGTPPGVPLVDFVPREATTIEDASDLVVLSGHFRSGLASSCTEYPFALASRRAGALDVIATAAPGLHPPVRPLRAWSADGTTHLFMRACDRGLSIVQLYQFGRETAADELASGQHFADVGDYDGDGILDIATGQDDGILRWKRGIADALFEDASDAQLSISFQESFGNHVLSFDLDDDGRDELLVLDTTPTGLAYWRVDLEPC